MQPTPTKSIQQVVAELGSYPIDAFEFVREGLSFTVQQVHDDPENLSPEQCHVTGEQLCLGLRDLAARKWGLLAPTVLARWGIRGTLDFGRIVYALVDNHYMKKQPTDSLEDFRDVYDFNTAFEQSVDLTRPDEES